MARTQSAIATKRQQKRCSNPDGCEKQPAYGKRGSAAIGATYCVVHRWADLHSSTFYVTGSTGLGRRQEDLQIEQPRFCRPSGFVNVKNRKCLGAWGIGCPKQPTFGAKEDSVPLYCSQHKREGLTPSANERETLHTSSISISSYTFCSYGIQLPFLPWLCCPDCFAQV